jgi:hypothetical protein
MADGVVRVRIVIENEQVASQLEEAIDIIREAASDTPWNEDLHEAVAKLNEVAESLMIVAMDDDSELDDYGFGDDDYVDEDDELLTERDNDEDDDEDELW